MGKRTCPNRADFPDNQIDTYWRIIFEDLAAIQQRYFATELLGHDLADEAEELHALIFLWIEQPHSGARDLRALERLDALLKEISGIKLSDFAATQLSLHADNRTDYANRTKPIHWDRHHVPTPTDALACLFKSHALLEAPIKAVHGYILNDHDPRSKINTINWKAVDAIRGCLEYWNKIKGTNRGFGQPTLDTQFGQFVNDIWEYFSIQGKPSSAMNALKRLETNTKG